MEVIVGFRVVGNLSEGIYLIPTDETPICGDCAVYSEYYSLYAQEETDLLNGIFRPRTDGSVVLCLACKARMEHRLMVPRPSADDRLAFIQRLGY